MHLSRKADAQDLFAAQFRISHGFANCQASGAPPVVRLLFGPTNLGGSKGLMFLRGGGNHAARLVDDDGASAAGAYVNSKHMHWHSVSPWCETWSSAGEI